LFHEATFEESEISRAKDTLHSTALQAANIAKKAEVGQLLIGHYSARYQNLNKLLAEARSVFPNTKLAEDKTHFQW
jgi:ribonuclease Z